MYGYSIRYALCNRISYLLYAGKVQGAKDYTCMDIVYVMHYAIGFHIYYMLVKYKVRRIIHVWI